jgi:hypothetical protein
MLPPEWTVRDHDGESRPGAGIGSRRGTISVTDPPRGLTRRATSRTSPQPARRARVRAVARRIHPRPRHALPAPRRVPQRADAASAATSQEMPSGFVPSRRAATRGARVRRVRLSPPGFGEGSRASRCARTLEPGGVSTDAQGPMRARVPHSRLRGPRSLGESDWYGECSGEKEQRKRESRGSRSGCVVRERKSHEAGT